MLGPMPNAIPPPVYFTHLENKKKRNPASENPNLKRNSDEDSSIAYKSRGSPEAGRLRTLQKDSSRGYKGRGSPEGGKPRTIQ